MADLNQSYQDAKFMSDDALKQELSAPSGLVPGYIIMAELQDRAGVRVGGGGQTDQPSMKDQLLAQNSAPPSRQYSRGGIISQLNPTNATAQVMKHPELAGGFIQDQINAQSGGLPSLSAAQAPGALQPPMYLSQLEPTQSGSPQAPQRFAHGGLASLLKGS
jgi:hypothetical protein